MKKEIRSKLKKEYFNLLECFEDMESFSIYTYLKFTNELTEIRKKYPNIKFDNLLSRWEKEWKRNKNEKN